MTTPKRGSDEQHGGLSAEPPSSKGRNALLALLTIVLMILSVSGLLLVTELAFRMTGVSANRAMLLDTELFHYKHYVVSVQPPGLVLGHSNSPLEGYFGVDKCATPEGVTARFNSDGFRSPEIRNVPPKADNEVRIIITGGSVAISWNIGERCTLDSVLKGLLSQRHPGKKITVFNLGSGAWKSFQELIALELYAPKLEPDLILVFDGFNDIQHAYSMPIEQPYSNHAEVAYQRYREAFYAGPRDLLKSFKIVELIGSWLKPVSVGLVNRPPKGAEDDSFPAIAAKAEPGHLATALEMPVNEERIGARHDFDPYNRAVVENYIRNIEYMLLTAGYMKAEVLLALQPTLYLKEPLSDQERRVLKTYVPTVNFVVQGYGRMREELERVSKKYPHSRFVDLSKAFAGNGQHIFGDYAHFSAEGYEIVGSRLVPEIESMLDGKLRGAHGVAGAPEEPR